MTAPAPGARSAPAGVKMDDGYQTLVSFATDPAASFWEKTVTPPGLDGGDPIDTNTMHNVAWRTMAPRALVTMTEIKITAAWDPALYITLLALLNFEDTVTVHFPDGSSLAFFGFLRTVEPGDLTEGTQPEITVTVTCTNQDPVTGDEEAPVYTTPPASPMHEPSTTERRSRHSPDRDRENRDTMHGEQPDRPNEDSTSSPDKTSTKRPNRRGRRKTGPATKTNPQTTTVGV